MSREPEVHVKVVQQPPGYVEWEAAGLRWLADADGASVVPVLGVHGDRLEIERLNPASPTREHAAAFGRALAITHDAGAPAFGVGPDGWTGDGWFGPAHDPLPLDLSPHRSWGEMFADARIMPFVRLGLSRGVFTETDVALFESVADRLRRGDFDTGDAPARLHGDLWSGNVFWTAGGAVLIDPAANAGDRESDLALLQLFGAPHLGTILGAYDEAHPLADGWQDRVALHQLHPLLMHAVVFAGGYVRECLQVAKRYR